LRTPGPSYRARLLKVGLGAAAAVLIVPLAGRHCRTEATPGVPDALLTAFDSFPQAPTELPPAVPLEPLLVADAPDRLAVLQPSDGAQNLRPGEPLVVRFNRPMVEGASVGKPVAVAPLAFSTPIAGRSTWTSRSTLTFEATKETWDRTRETVMKTSPALRSLAGEQIVESSPHTVVFDNGPQLLRSGSGSRLVPGEPVKLWFTGKVDTSLLAPGLMAYEVDGGRRMLPFTTTTSARDARGQTRVDLTLRTTLQPGAQFAVAVAPPLSHGGSQPRVIELAIAPRPHIEGIDCPENATDASACSFTAPPGKIVDVGEALRLLSSEPLDALRSGSVVVTPQLVGLEAQLSADKLLVIRGNFVPGQVYEVRVDGLRDKEGRALSRLPVLAVRSAGVAPEVKAPGGRLTFERDAAAILPLSAIHVEDGEARVAAVAAGKELEALFDPGTLVGSASLERAARMPLLKLVPGARPNRWGKGTLRWAETEKAPSNMVVVALLADATNKQQSSPAATFLQRTDLGIDAKVFPQGVAAWVTSIATAQPVGGATISVGDGKQTFLGTVTADARGVAWFPIPEGNRLESEVVVKATRGDDRAVMVVDPRTSMGPRHFGVTPGEAPPAGASVLATVFTDRGIVRPGETFHAKAVVRDGAGDAFALPRAGMLHFAVFGPTGEAAIVERDATISGFGTADVDFDLDPSAATGTYRIEARVEGQPRSAGVATFSVSDYRAPTFRVDLESAVHDVVERETLRVDIAAAYLFGTPAAGRSAHFTITRGAAADPLGWDDYAFGPVDTAVSGGTMAAGEVKLDESGRAFVASVAEIGAKRRADATVEVSVTDVSGLSTTARHTIALHPSDAEVGIRRSSAWLDPSSMLDIEAVALSHAGEAVAGQIIEARMVREGWHRYWEWSGGSSDGDDGDDGDDDHAGTKPDGDDAGGFQARRTQRTEVVHQCKLTSTLEPVHCTFKPERAGTYLLEAVARDPSGRASVASQRVYLAGPDEHPDRDPPGAAVALTLADDTLEVGATAVVAFDSPFPDAETLFEVHQGGILHSEVRRVAAGGNVFRFPVTGAMVPNAFVSLTLVRPRTGPPSGKVDLDAPDLRVGLTELTVRPAASPLTVSLEALTRADAGEDVEIDVFVEDGAGRGVAAEVALFAVDEGTLRVTGYSAPDAVSGLFPRRAPAFAWEDLRRSLVSRVTEPLMAGAGGDGGEATRKAPPEVLPRFEPTPLWLPRLVTDDSGHATAELHLPERATEYRIMAIAVDQGIRSGRAERGIVVSMPVVVRPVLPAAATVGDRFEAVAFVHNTEDEPVDVSITTTVGGMPRAPTTIHVPARGETRVAEWVDVERAGELDIIFDAQSDRGTTRSGGTVATMIRGRKVDASAVGAVQESRTITVDVPERPAGPITLAIASHPFVGFDASLEALLASPWAGVETAASSLIGLGAYARLDTGKRPGSAGPEEVRARAASAMKRLASMQTSNGGFGAFSPNDGADPYLTAFALHAISSAGRAGLPIDEPARLRARTQLAELVRDGSFLDGSDGGHDQLAFALRVLAEEDAPSRDRNGALFDQRERLSPYGLAQLAMALDADDFRRVTLAVDSLRVLATRDDELRSPNVLRWYEGSARTFGAVLEAASGMEAMIGSTPELASRLLLSRSATNGSWGGAHETSQALAALAAYAEAFRADDPVSASVTIDGTVIRPTDVSSDLAFFSIAPGDLAPGSHQLRIEVEDAAWFALGSSAMVPLGEADEVARGSAATLHRRLEDATGKPLGPEAHVKLGDLVRVRLFLFTEHDAPPYLAVVDHLAGGLSPVDGALETNPREALSALLGMGADDEVTDARAHYASRSLDIISHRALSPSEAVFYLASAGSGLHELTYGVRAVAVGTFVLPPAEVSALYAPGFAARSALATLVVDP